MLRSRHATTSAALFVMAALSYAANCALGAAVALRLVDTSGFRWLHHALYVTTCGFTAIATGTGIWNRQHRAIRRAAVLLMPAALPLAAVPYVGTHTRRHPLIALAAAPFVAASLALALRPADRK